jgi:hypothetical protein
LQNGGKGKEQRQEVAKRGICIIILILNLILILGNTRVLTSALGLDVLAERNT